MFARLYRGAILGAALATMISAGCKQFPVNPGAITDSIFALNCPGVTEHFANVDTFLVIGHRGAPSEEVENTILSYQRALDEGANAIELDFCMTKDGQIVVWHDWNPDDAIALVRESGAEVGMKYRPRFPPLGSAMRRPMDELTEQEFRDNYWYATKNLIDKQRVPAEIPTFRQFVEWASKQDRLHYVFFDIKLPENKSYLADEMMGKMDSILKEYQPRFRGIYMSPHPTVWSRITEVLGGAVPLSFDVDLGGGLVSDNYCDISSSHYARQRGYGFATTMHPFAWTQRPWTTLMNLLTCDLTTRDTPHEEGVKSQVEKVIAATIDDEEKMQCLVELGIDGLMTNKPAVLHAIAVAHGKHVQ